MATKQVNDMVMVFIEDLKKSAFFRKNVLKRTWISGSCTTVYPVMVWPQGEIDIQWESNKPCNKFIQDMVAQHSNLLDKGYFRKSDGSCPSSLCFIVRGWPLMNDNQLYCVNINGKYFEQEDTVIFKKGDVVVAKKQFVEKHETEEDTLGIVLDYNPENDALSLGTLHPEKYALPPIFSMRGEFYRLVTASEKKKWNIK